MAKGNSGEGLLFRVISQLCKMQTLWISVRQHSTGVSNTAMCGATLFVKR